MNLLGTISFEHTVVFSGNFPTAGSQVSMLGSQSGNSFQW